VIKPRTLSRRLALQYCFICDVNDAWNMNGWSGFLADSNDEADAGLQEQAEPFARELVETIIAQRETIDGKIADCTHNWEINRLATVERNVLRLAAGEILNGKLDKRIIISEAVTLANSFGSKDSGKFVNGILDALANA